MSAATLVFAANAATPTVPPETVGLSSDRLSRVTELMQRHIDAGTFAGWSLSSHATAKRFC
jgi:hypothetical protein